MGRLTIRERKKKWCIDTSKVFKKTPRPNDGAGSFWTGAETVIHTLRRQMRGG